MSDIESSGSEEEEFIPNLEDEETADEKRLRLAKQYLSEIQEEESDNEEDGNERVAKRLRLDVEVRTKKHKEQVASSRKFGETKFIKCHKLPITCVALAPGANSHIAFTGGKDCIINQIDLNTGIKVISPGGRNGLSYNKLESVGHTDHVLSICPLDSNVIITGGKDKQLLIWDVRDGYTPKPSGTFKGIQHQDAITGIRRNPDSQEIYTTSVDKTVRVWNMSVRSYQDALFGHNDEINQLDILQNSRPLTCSSDRTLRSWKVQNDTHLIYQGYHQGPIDACTIIDHELMASAGQDGNMAIWSSTSRKPLATCENAHGVGQWITSLRAVQSTDLLYSGGLNQIKAWKVTKAGKKEASLELIQSLDVSGYITEMCATKEFCIASVAKEHRLGRWTPCKKAKNGLIIWRTSDEPKELKENVKPQ